MARIVHDIDPTVMWGTVSETVQLMDGFVVKLFIKRWKTKILEVCKITPPLGSPTDDILLPLTFFDLFNIIFPPVEILFFYETLANRPHPIILSKLKHSLSLAIGHFLPVAGNLVWTHLSLKPIIRYQNGDGVLLAVTQSDDDFYHLSSKNIRESKVFNPLVARIVKSGPHVPVIAIKITLFPNKGICIGVTVHHSLFDATSVTLFMNAWAHFAQFGEKYGFSKELVPIFDRKSIREQYIELENSYIKILNQNDVTLEKAQAVLGPERPVGTFRGSFVLSYSEVTKLKELVKSQLENNNQIPHISTFAVTYAYVIICLLKVKPPKNKKVNVAFAFDCRDRLDPPLPKNYFGNAVGGFDTRLDTYELLGSDGMARLVDFISKSTKELADGGALRGVEEWLPNMFRAASDTETLRVFVVGASRFDYESVDFGWGRPRKVDIVSIDGTGGVIFTQGDDKNKGDIEVDLSLKEGEMERFAYIFTQANKCKARL